MANPFIYAVTDQRWSSAITAYNAIWMDVNNGAGGDAVGTSASRLLKLSNNTVERFGVTINGSLLTTSPTLTTSDPSIFTQTWNAAGVTFTGVRIAITSTASAAGSLIIDAQVGASAVFNVRKDGAITTTSGMRFGFVSTVSYPVDIQFNDNAIQQVSGNYLGWSSSATNAGAGSDLKLFRDAANTLAQRNSTNAQTFNIYNTYTDASNYERGFAKWSGSVFQVGTEAAGTGSTRNLSLYRGATEHIQLSSGRNFFPVATSMGAGINFSFSDGTDFNRGFVGVTGAKAVKVTDGSTAGGALQFQEMTAPSAPATNLVYLYAQDNGAGKTQIMALFATGAAQQVAIEP